MWAGGWRGHLVGVKRRRRERLLGFADGVERRLAASDAADVFGHRAGAAAGGAGGHAGHVRGGDHVRQPEQRVVDGQRLLGEDVEPGAGQLAGLRAR